MGPIGPLTLNIRFPTSYYFDMWPIQVCFLGYFLVDKFWTLLQRAFYKFVILKEVRIRNKTYTFFF